MAQRRNGSIPILFMLAIYLDCNIVLCQINMNVVAVFENDYKVARDVVNKVFEWFAKQEFPDVTFNYNSITIDSGLTESQVCQRIIDPKPTILIDTTRKTREVGNRAGTLVKKISRKMGVPTVSATYGKMKGIMGWENLDDTEKQYLVQISPPGYIITQVVRDIASHQNMTTAGVLIDEKIEMDQKSPTLLQNIPTPAAILTVPLDKQKIQQELLKLKTANTANYFVIGSTNITTLALEVADANNMTGREYAWYIVSLDPKEPVCSCKRFTTLWMSPRPITSKKSKAENLASSFEVQSQVEVAFYYDLVLFTIQAVRNEMMKGNWPNEITYQSCASEQSINPQERSNIKLLTSLKQEAYEGMFGKFKIKETGSYQELELYLRKLTFVAEGPMKPQRIGVWTYDQPTGKIKLESGSELKMFSAITVYRVTTLTIPPFIVKNEDENGTITFTGYCVELLDEIKNILNFEYTIFETADKKFGTMNDKLEWDGMMRDLIDKRADIALGPISVMAERETVVDFTVPYYDLVGISILMKKPSVPPSLFKFLTVLEANVWACILAAYFVTSFLMFVFDRLSPYSYYNNKEKYKDDDEDEKRDFSLKESLWFCMTSLTPQGGGEAPRNLSGRLVAATWWLFGFIIIASYTANLAAFLTVSRLDSPIESLDDLAKQYKIKYAPQASTSAATYFERMAYIEEKFYEIWKNMSLDDSLNETERAKLAVWDYPVSDKYTKIWWTMKETGMPKTFQEGVDKVLASKGSQDGFAFIADSTQVKYAVMINCQLTSVGSEFSRKPLALAVQQGSPLKDQLSSAILKLLNQRKLEGLKEKWWNKNPAKVECDDSEQQSDGISIANIGGVFIVIFIGVVLAVITLGIEYLFYKKRKQRNTRVVTVEKYPNERHRRH
uniref:Ionotropic receptor 25a n=1 Tax=Pardosa pseudoannulata TaxID=330961 RepID=A0A7S5HEF3_9ARAC|nr:ionotropic receptor 25a [Pardosa pseudoannulata]